MNEMSNLLDELEERMMKSEDSMKHDFSAIRTGKASTALVDPITIDYYGTQTKLRDVAGISTPDPRTITIQPWDKSVLAKIEKASSHPTSASRRSTTASSSACPSPRSAANAASSSPSR